MYVCCGPVRMQCCDRRLAKRTIEHRSLHKMFACAWDRVLNVFLATSIFLGGFANPPAVWLKCRVWQVQYIYIYVFNPETRSSYVRSTVHGLATSLVRLGPFGYPTSNIRVGLLVLYIVYVHFLARIAMYIASFEHHWLRLGPAMRLDIQHSSWFVGSLHRLCTFFGTHSHVHCKF
jgi:hypothetical protein